MQAIVLAAGAGTRLRDVATVKPLARVGGKTLLRHALEGLTEAGVTETIVVTGYEADLVAVEARDFSNGCTVLFAHNANWDGPNGLSVLAAAPLIAGPALLTMCDHLVDPALYARVAAASQGTTLGIDRRLGHPWVDLDDVTRVATAGDRIVAIGKHLDPHDAYDTGVFRIETDLFDALRVSDRPSLSDGMTRLAREGRAFAVETGDLDWIDVDDPRALAMAEAWSAPR